MKCPPKVFCLTFGGHFTILLAAHFVILKVGAKELDLHILVLPPILFHHLQKFSTLSDYIVV